MSHLVIHETSACENIGCTSRLGYFDIKNGSRFCRKCRVSNNVLVWKCKGCDNRLYSSQSRETRKFCDDCKGLSIKF
jgi:hypothetical protein